MGRVQSAWKAWTPMLVFSCFCLVVGDMLFGFDTGSFGGILAMPGFVNQFGIETNGKWAMTPVRTSLVSSLAFIGKAIGCLTAGPLIEWLGHRKVFFVLCVISCIGVIIEITAADTGIGTGRLAQFIVGRIIVYVSIGLVEICVSTYQAEIVPAPLRGFTVCSLQLFLNAGGLLASGVNKALSTETSSRGWRTTTGLQLIFPVLIVAFVPFIPDSPRWLLSKDRHEDALTALRRLRTKDEVASGACTEELAVIQAQLQQKVHKASWLDCFRGTNARRTWLVVVFYIYQQITGQAFVSTYQTVFYKANGYATHAFTYPIISSVLSLVAVIPCMYFSDVLGRRAVLMGSFFFQALWLCLLAGIGERSHKTQSMKDACVAFLMLFMVSYSFGGAPVPYLLGAELPNHSLREKTQTIGTTVNVVFAFATNFSIPYMLKPLAFKVGWIFGGISISALIFTFLFLPETKNLTLEQVDQVFEKPFNPFRGMRGIAKLDQCTKHPALLEEGGRHDSDQTVGDSWPSSTDSDKDKDALRYDPDLR